MLDCFTRGGGVPYDSYRRFRETMAEESDQTVVAAPQFLTGDERYTWLNGVQAIAKGKTDGQTLVYDIHEVR